MASEYYGLDRGEQQESRETAVTEDSSTTSKSLELVIDLTAGWTKLEIVEALDRFKETIMNGTVHYDAKFN